MEVKLLVPVTVTVDDAHLAEILSPEWASVMYEFEGDDEDSKKRNVASYIARLMLLFQRPLNEFDGHAHQPDDVAKCVISEDDEEWSSAGRLSENHRDDLG